MNLPSFTPPKGKALIAFTAEQMKTYNQYGRIWVEDRFNPDQHSIEEAVIAGVSVRQEDLKKGDSVIVDYGIFTAGRHRDRKTREESRRIYQSEEYSVYWCYDNQDAINQSEIRATVDDLGKAKAFADNVLLYSFEETEVLVEVVASLTDLHELPGTQWALVYSSPVPEISDGDMILIEKGLSPALRFRGIELQYINLSFIVGKADKSKEYNLQLF